jgi:hypothetical protein
MELLPSPRADAGTSPSNVSVEVAATTTTTRKSNLPAGLPLGKKVPFKVPRRAEELTPEWMTTMLRFRGLLSDDVSVSGVDRKGAIGDGVMGDISAVELTYSGPTSAPAKMVAKFSPVEKAPLPGLVVRFIFSAEAHFYNDFSIAGGGLLRPECYIALYNPKVGWPLSLPSFCMLLEDMRPARIFSRCGPKGAGVGDKEALMGFMAGIAKLHARWWDHPKKAPLKWATHPRDDLFGLVLRGFMHTAKSGLPLLMKCYPETYAAIRSWLPQLKRRHRFIVNECLRGPLTLTHGDAHIENVFFDERFDGGAAFIDFGNAMFSPGTSDVAFFMVHSLEPDVRRAHEAELVKHYHASLIAAGVDGAKYPYERCWHDYRFNMWRALLSVCAMAPQLYKQLRKKTGIFAADGAMSDEDRKNKTLYENLNHRCVAALQDHKWLDLLIEESGGQSCGLCSGISICY